MEGYFRKRGNKWSFTVDIGRDPKTGKRVQLTKSGFKTKKEAQAHCAKVISEVETDSYIKPVKRKLADYLMEWLSSKKQSIRTSTYQKYKSFIDTHIIPNIGQLEINNIEKKHINDFYNYLADELELAATTRQSIHACLKSAFNDAELPKNVMESIKRPTGKRRKMKIWTEEEALLFLEKIKGTTYYLTYFLALTTGMRQGEILGLPINNVDFKRKNLYITQILTHDGKSIQEIPKSNTSFRSISLDQHTLDALYIQIEKQKQLKNNYNGDYNPHSLVFTSNTGYFINSRNVLRFLYNFYKKNPDIPKISFHEMRHSHLSYLLMRKENVKAVAERSGHADASILLSTYAHVLPNMQDTLANDFGESFFKKGN